MPHYSPVFRFEIPADAIVGVHAVSERSSAISAATAVTVTVPARLHLGFLDLDGTLGRRFGSIGLAISGFQTRLSLAPAGETRVDGPESARVRAHFDTMRAYLRTPRAYAIRIDDVVPAHVGLGSGTQLALALATALRRAAGVPPDLASDAERLGRGARSGAGIGLFQRGGLVVDGGRGRDTLVPPIVSRLAFPEHWAILVVLDRARQGIHGAAERGAFAALPPFGANAAAHLCHLVLMNILPAVAEADLPRFGAALAEMQARLGDHFAPMQGGGRFTSPDVARALAIMAEAGATGIGQSSWGPTGFAFAPSETEAMRCAAAALADPACRGLDIRVCRALNRGAETLVRAGLDAHDNDAPQQ